MLQAKHAVDKAQCGAEPLLPRQLYRSALPILAIALAFVLAGALPMSNAQTVDDFKKQRELAEAERAANEAELARLESFKRLNDAKTAPSAAAVRNTGDINAAIAAKNLAEAEKGQTEAELAAYKARMSVPSSGITGTVTPGTGAAVMETALLASKATTEAAARMAGSVTARIKDKTSAVYVFSPGDLPDFQAAIAFRLQQAAVQKALGDAAGIAIGRNDGGSTSSSGGGTPERESAGTIGIALEAATKLLGYFKSDFNVAGSDVTADNYLLQQAFAGQLLALNSEQKVYLYSLYFPTAASANKLPEGMSRLAATRNSALDILDALQKESATLSEQLRTGDGAGAPGKPAKASLENALKLNDAKVTQVKTALAAYDALLVRLYAADGSGGAILRQGALLSALAVPGTVLVMMKLNKAGGSNYTEKNLWTAFGAMPFRVAGGVVASFSAFDAASGNVLAAETIEVHGGYVKANKVGERIATANIGSNIETR